MTAARRQLLKIQKSLYDKAYADAHSLVDNNHHSIIQYSNKFTKSLPDQFEVITTDSFLDSLRQARFILYGDFHTLKQSQRGLLRICRDILNKKPKSKIVLALECFRAQDQDQIELFMKKEIDEIEFLDSIEYAKYWGFPWNNYRMILDFASEFNIPVVGINTSNGGMDTMLTRDKFATKILLDALAQYPMAQIFCLIGEYHLADTHLPRVLSSALKRIDRSDKVLRTLTNVDRYYFELHQRGDESSTQYLKLSPDVFCIMNSPPWLKWQSYAIFEETRHSTAILAETHTSELDPSDDSDVYTEDTFDVDYQIQSLLTNLADFLQIPLDQNRLLSCNVFTGTEHETIELFLQEDRQSKGAEIDRYVERALTDGMFYAPECKTIILTKFSLNSMAEATGQFLHHEKSGFSSGGSASFGDFYRRVIKSAIGMLSSLVFNPRRKLMDIANCERYLSQNRKLRLLGTAKLKRQTAAAVIAHHHWMTEKTNHPKPSMPRQVRRFYLTDLTSNYDLSRRIGHLLGQQLYLDLTTGQRSTAFVRDLFCADFKDDSYTWQIVCSLYQSYVTRES